jgi:L-xylulokinase
MAISPASTANYDWFLDTLCKAEAGSDDIHARLAAEVDEALARPSSVLFHPYLFGSPHGPVASAGFTGLRGWHERGDMLRAVLEGIAFNHRDHVDALRDGFPFQQARLTGGASRNPAFVQMFADSLAMPVTVTQTEEAAAWGTALCAGAACGLYASPLDDPRDLASLEQRFEPDEKRSAAYETRYRLWREIAESMSSHWPAIDALADEQP